jgi:hypothetical protein
MLAIALTLDRAAEWGEVVTGVATAGLVIAAIVAGVLAGKQIRTQRQIAQRARVYEHLAPFHDLKFLEMTADIGGLIRTFEQDPAKGRAMYNAMSGRERAKVQAVFNFYEEVASEYNAGFLDEEAARRSLVYVTAAMYEGASGLVDWLRGSDPTYLEEWVRLHEKLKGRRGTPGFPAGWYEDPDDRTRQKWWDGFRWREYTRG